MESLRAALAWVMPWPSTSRLATSPRMRGRMYQTDSSQGAFITEEMPRGNIKLTALTGPGPKRINMT